MKVIYKTKSGEIREYVYDSKKYYKSNRKVDLNKQTNTRKAKTPVTCNIKDIKDVPGFEGLYCATKDGRIYSYKRNMFLKPYENASGYLQVGLCKDGIVKQLFVHRVIATTYIPNPNNLPEVNHKNEKKHDCSVDNLEWMTHRDNCNYGTRNKRISKPVRCIELNRCFDSITDAAIKLKLDGGNIYKACNNIYNTTGGYHWEYVK